MTIPSWVKILSVIALLLILGSCFYKVSQIEPQTPGTFSSKKEPVVVEEPKVTVKVDSRGIENWLKATGIESLPKNNTVTVCSGHGCAFKQKYRLKPELIAEVKRLMERSKTAEEERNNLKLSLNRIKFEAGLATGTHKDRPGEPFFGNGDKGQMSNLDETYNTAQYLYVISPFLKYHNLDKPSSGSWYFGTLNNITDVATKKQYSISYDKAGAVAVTAK